MPQTNLTANPYRGLSVQEVDFDADSEWLLAWLVDREVYRRTDFVLLVSGDHAALLAVKDRRPAPAKTGEGLFTEVISGEVVAMPEQLVMIDSPDTDVGIASHMAEIAQRNRSAGVHTYVVRGRYKHVNFICSPEPVDVLVDEVVPPHPPKLVQMARQAISFDESLAPIRLTARLTSIPTLTRRRASRRSLLPCKGADAPSTAAGSAGESRAGTVDFLDAGPAYRDDWTLVGCRRSAQIFEHHYGEQPSIVDFCPLANAAAEASGPLRLTKCCQLERGITVVDNVATVPWGATLDEVRQALAGLLASLEPENDPVPRPGVTEGSHA